MEGSLALLRAVRSGCWTRGERAASCKTATTLCAVLPPFPPFHLHVLCSSAAWIKLPIVPRQQTQPPSQPAGEAASGRAGVTELT